ncbi:MAG: PDDEXK nuclease domain-containing protein [Candidatus Margulisiibacteriota bacterium]
MGSKVVGAGYHRFLREIKERIRAAQYEALKAVNKELINLYWDIGKMIVLRQKRNKWGGSIVKKLAADLQKEFPGTKGFSFRNIWYMRNFYKTYKSNTKLQPLVAEIGWTHNLIILDKCENDLEREFYIRMTQKYGWTKNALIHQIDNKTYERTMLNQTSFNKNLPERIKNQARFAVKDEYMFDFLEFGEEYGEKELEAALIAKVSKFLAEMGGAFAFMGNQFRLEINGNDFFIDILLYHRRLKCLVAIELKIGKFIPEYVGKMQFYLAALDDLVKLRGENPSIGIILCKDKDRTIVEYALRKSSGPIGVAKYRILKQLPKKLKGELPSPENVKALMGENGI